MMVAVLFRLPALEFQCGSTGVQCLVWTGLVSKMNFTLLPQTVYSTCHYKEPLNILVNSLGNEPNVASSCREVLDGCVL